MTDPTRGARLRRGARRPGWLLMTALLLLAIGASSALVFTNRVELLKLAVLLALWAAVVAAFVSVIYRRQSDSDQAKARDLKLVYDLQLDREISARREYELAVETQLRRELSAELRVQASEEVSALRAELAALRANLEYLFDADLSNRPAIETDRAGARALGEWTPGADTAAGRVSISRIDAEDVEEVVDDVATTTDTEESPIIDVPAEPHPPEDERGAPVDEAGGAHRRFSEQTQANTHRADESPGRRREPPPSPPPPPPKAPPSQAEPHYPWLPPPAPEPPRPQPRTTEPTAPAAAHWQPAPAEGRWIPPGAPGSHWAPGPGESGARDEYVGRRRAPDAPPQDFVGQSPPVVEPPRGRHSGSASETGDRMQAAHLRTDTAEAPAPAAGEPVVPEHAVGGAHTGGPSVAELMARLQATKSGGGRRRRRED